MTPRRATGQDAAAITVTQRRGWCAAYRGIFPDPVLDDLPLEPGIALWSGRIAQPESEIWVIDDTEADTPVPAAGFIFFGQPKDAADRQNAEICGLYVRPEYHGRGWGRILMTLALERLSGKDAPVVGRTQALVWCLDGNTGGRAFYTRMGGVEVDRRMSHFTQFEPQFSAAERCFAWPLPVNGARAAP